MDFFLLLPDIHILLWVKCMVIRLLFLSDPVKYFIRPNLYD